MTKGQRKTVILTFEPDGTKSEFKKGTRILDALSKAGLNIRTECGGRGVCGKCKIIVKDSSSLSAVTEAEKELLSSSERKFGCRLACACSAVSDAIVYLPKESRVRTRKILIEGTEIPVPAEPAIRKVFVRIPKPSLCDVRPDFQRLQNVLKEIYGVKTIEVGHQLLKKLPEILRNSNWKVTITIWDEREIISIDKGNTSEKAYGVAVDIGTSKIIGYLSNLFNGGLIATESMENPQIMHGEDIISRISYASKSDGSLKELQKLVVNCLNAIIFQTCKKSAINPKSVYEITVEGNTAM
ncbi:MAG: 2Fe-2S iron-sulfur cluster-binding protein, partial [Candidatus Bathyarchaeota archaeon]|nr:2Fe-2S iron-sulfur cluster-binding protein [Candidatus Bathyarchaeota archaeon]